MKNLLKTINANKGVIAKRGLIIVGAITGLTIGAVVLIKGKQPEDENIEEEDVENKEVSEVEE